MTIKIVPFLALLVFLLPPVLAGCSSKSSSVPKDRPDLQIVSMAFDPPSPLAGEVVAVTAVVRNAGTADAPATMAGVTVDGTQTCSEIPTLALPINQTAAVVCSLTAPPNGSHGVGVCADVTGVADEPDESNNCLLQTLVVGAGVTARP